MYKEYLKVIDKENWRFILYESQNGNWIGDFSYSPKSFIDLSLLIQLTDNEKTKAQNDRSFLIELSDLIRNNYNEFMNRALNRDKFQF